MPICEHCGLDKPDARRREYSRPLVIDPAAARPQAAGGRKIERILMCDDCDREARQPDSETWAWVERRLGEPL
jgi:hypothetical protein